MAMKARGRFCMFMFGSFDSITFHEDLSEVSERIENDEEGRSFKVFDLKTRKMLEPEQVLLACIMLRSQKRK